MARQCPENKFVGLGILRGWKWFIDERGYANITQSSQDLVYGLVYEISPSDEASLDRWEEVPQLYTKEMLGIDLHSVANGERSLVQSLVYVDGRRVEEGEPRKEYIHWMNMGINDAVARGLPRWYIDKYIRRFIPAEGGKEAAEGFKPEKEALHHTATDTKSNLE